MAQRFDLGSTSQIPAGEGRNFEVGGCHLAVFHARSGRMFATQAECPHRGGPLADGLVGDCVVVCPLHEQRFDLSTGQALAGPCPIQVFPLAVDDDGWMTVELP